MTTSKRRKRAEERADISGLYRSAWKYVRESKVYVLAIIALFFLSMMMGFAFPSLFALFDDVLAGIVDETEGLSASGLIVYIFANNFQSSLYGMLFGVLIGLFPIGATVLNGTLIGYVLRLSWNLTGASEFWRLLPHGIFELPAVFIALGLGIRLGGWVFAKEKVKMLAHHLYHSLLVFVLIIVPLLVLAAVIEGLLIAFEA